MKPAALALRAQDPSKQINPSLPTVARYVNTLAKWGVPREKRHIIVMFHQRSPDFGAARPDRAAGSPARGRDRAILPYARKR